MASPFTARQAGIASLVAAALILVSQVSQLVLPMVISESFWIATQTLRLGLSLVAMFALLIALTGIYAQQASATGKLGLVGYLTASLGTVLVAGDWWYEAFIGPMLRQQAPELLNTAISGSILIGAALTIVIFAAGWVIFALSTFRAGIAPRGAAILMLLGGIAGILTLISPFQVPLALAVGWMGLWLVRSGSRENQPARSAATATA
jgi:uncharacterized membrane protein (DUF485 family)